MGLFLKSTYDTGTPSNPTPLSSGGDTVHFLTTLGYEYDVICVGGHKDGIPLVCYQVIFSFLFLNYQPVTSWSTKPVHHLGTQGVHGYVYVDPAAASNSK